MTTYRFFDGASGRPGAGSSSGVVLPSAPSAYTGDYSTGLVFSVTAGGKWLDGYWWYVPHGGQTTSGATFALWQVTSAAAGTLVANSGVTAGTLTAATTAGNANGWNYIPLTTPLQLSQDVAYCAVIAYNSTVGFPQQKNVFGASTDPFPAGITNGWANLYSSTGGTNPCRPQGSGATYQPQMPYDVGTTNASAAMPTINDDDDILWLDVQLDDTPPAGYTSRIWPNFPVPYGMYANSVDGEYTLCNEFDLSATATLLRLWFLSPSSTYGPAAVSLPTEVGIFNVGGGAVSGSVISSPTWSGAAGSGWVSVDYTGSGGLTLPAGYYLPYVTFAGGSYWYGTVVGYYTTGEGASGLTNGIVSTPSNANAHGPSQGTYSTSYATYPNVVVSNGEVYYVDMEVSTPADVTGVGGVVELVGGVGTPSGAANITGVGAVVELIGGQGTPSGAVNFQGVAGVVKPIGGVGIPSGAVNLTGTGAVVDLAGGIGTPSGAVDLTGTGAVVDLDGGTGTPNAAEDITGTGAVVELQGGQGSPSTGAADVIGVAAVVEVAGGVGTPYGGGGAQPANVTGVGAVVDVAGGRGVGVYPIVLDPELLSGTLVSADLYDGTLVSANQHEGSLISANQYGGSLE